MHTIRIGLCSQSLHRYDYIPEGITAYLQTCFQLLFAVQPQKVKLVVTKMANGTRSNGAYKKPAIAVGPHNVLRRLKSCQLLHSL